MIVALVPALVLAGAAPPAAVPACRHLPTPRAAEAAANDNLAPAGVLRGRTLYVRMSTVRAAWYPDGVEGCGLAVLAFAEPGRAPSIPGPLIRVSAGTRVRVVLSNPLDHPIVVRGLGDRPADPLHPVRIAAGGTHTFDFIASTPGSYFYWARKADSPILGSGEDGQLAGALIVDPPGAPPADRVLVLTRWSPPGHLPIAQLPEADPETRRFEINVVNGKSWPHTERLAYTTDDTVRLRVLNAGGDAHVMHLHGFHYRVTARGDNSRDTVFRPADRPLLVSEILTPARTMAIEWVPTRPGNWIFHCHLQRHMSGAQRLDRIPRARREKLGGRNGHADHDMAGLIVGLTVRAGARYQQTEETPRRRLRLFANRRDRGPGEAPAYGFVLQQEGRAPASDSVLVPGSPLILRRGEPTEIVVHNRIGKPLSVHWHGLELESEFDGVAGWSGRTGRIARSTPHGDSLAVWITPPRAGTFIYHVHGGDPLDLASGLYGAFIVVPPDRPRALPENDRVFVVSRVAGNDTATVVNGSRTPAPVDLQMGKRYRFRIIGIMPQEGDLIRLDDPEGVVRWKLVARDGAESSEASVNALGPGMTLDYGLTPLAPGEAWLELRTISLLGRPLEGAYRVPIRILGGRP